MKKLYTFYLVLLCCMGVCFTSCSDDENGGSADVPAGNMRVSAVFPKSLTDDSLGLEMSGHQLRFIIELWKKDDAGQLAYRAEQLVTPVKGQHTVTVEVPVSAGTYDCLMWADYIDTGASAQAGEGGSNRYTDKYYDTSDLHNVRVKDMNALVDNNACDAFFYTCEVDKGGDACLLDVEMMRPFTRVSLVEKNLREFSLLQGLSATFTSYPLFNVATGMVGEETAQVNVNYPDFDPSVSSNGTLFSTYIFANAESRNWGNVEVTFMTDFHGTQTVTVPDIVPLVRGNHVKVSGNMMAESPEPDTEFEISFDINVEDWVDDVVDVEISGVAAKVGDYFFADGTWSGVLTEENKDDCVGIIYAIGANREDNISNYGSDAAGKEIVGYVMALKNTGIPTAADGSSLFPDPTTQYLLSNSRPYFYKQSEAGGAKDDDVVVLGKQTDFSWDIFNGITATQALLENETYTGAANQTDYPVLLVFDRWKATASQPVNASEWYVPSSAQLYEAAMKCYADTYELKDSDRESGAWTVAKDDVLLNAFNAAIEAGVAETFCGNNNANGYYIWTSTMNPDGMPMAIQIGAAKLTSLYPKPNYRTQGLIRPFLTIIK